MTLHVVGLPHTQFTDDFSWCAYTTKVRRFATMMAAQGCDVITYGNGQAAPAAGKYFMVTDETFEPSYIPAFDPSDPAFAAFNAKATAGLVELVEDGDLVCLIGGTAQALVAGVLGSRVPVVEFGIGYEGVLEGTHKVFESYTWQSYLQGKYGWQGSATDTVIHNYFDPDDFHTGATEDYVLFLGRVCLVKGVDIAVQACRQAGLPLKIAGHVYEDAGWVRGLGGPEYVGEVGPSERADLLAHAAAIICPTRYAEPFCGVHVEAMLSGAPVICPDWGIFTETVEHGMDGLRCRTLDDYTRALGRLDEWDDARRSALSWSAARRFSTDAIGPQYARHFDALL